MRAAVLQVGAVDRLAALGPAWDALFDAGPGLQSRRAWFAATEAAALPAGESVHLVTVESAGQPVALLPMRTQGRRMITSLTSPYTTQFQPLLHAEADAVAVGRALATHLRRWPVARLEALDPAWPGLPLLLAGLRSGGLAAHRFDHFGNWTEPVAGLSWAGYLAQRPGALRETIRRRGRAAARDPSIRTEVVAGAEGLGPAIAAYEAVYARSWKVPEPYARFNEQLLPRAAAMGVLRLAVMWQAGTPLAAQYWTVVDGVATVLKLAHDDAAKALSPGTLLTAHMVRRLLEHEHVAVLDFGRGDDPYKASWVGSRTQRVGVILANPLRPRGMLEVGRSLAGVLRRAWRGRREG